MQLKDNLVRTVQFNTKNQCVYMLAGAHAHSYMLLLLLHCARLHYWGTFSPNAHTMHLEYSNTFNWFYPNIYVSKQKDDCKQIETMFLLLRCFFYIVDVLRLALSVWLFTVKVWRSANIRHSGKCRIRIEKTTKNVPVLLFVWFCVGGIFWSWNQYCAWLVFYSTSCDL